MTGTVVEVRDGKITRQRLVELVEDYPGLHITEMSDRLGLAWSTVEHHLRALADTYTVDLHKTAREVLVFPSRTPARERGWFACIHDETKESILRTAIQHSEVGITTLSHQLNLSTKVVKTKLLSLVNAGLMIRLGDFRPKFRLTRESRRWVDDVLLQDCQ